MPDAVFALLQRSNGVTSAASLQPYEPSAAKPWDAQRVAHLYRRLGFGASYEDIQQGLTMHPAALVDHLLDQAAALPPPAPPQPEDWSNWTTDDYAGSFTKVEEHRRYLRHRWLSEMLDEGVRAKMAHFWLNHFVTKIYIVGCNAYTWKYYELLNRFALGNFRDFAVEMGKNPAMLVFLNGNVNEAGNPNENYARELMELFTLGEGKGYTQMDVVEMSRAMTGWRASFNDCTPHYFDPSKHDNGVKTILGATGPFDFDEAHLLIFQQRPHQVAEFIAGKLYRHLVAHTPDPAIVAEMAETFRGSNWELLPMLKQLLKSEHFFEERFFHVQIKSPLDLLIGVLKMCGVRASEHVEPAWWDDVAFWLDKLGQTMFDPPNVAGWPGHRAWINESTLANRWKFTALLTMLISKNEQVRQTLRTTAKGLTNNSKDPQTITAALISFFCGIPLDAIHLSAAVDSFKSGIPEGYFDNGSWNLDWDEAPYQVLQLLQYLARQPEFQLM